MMTEVLYRKYRPQQWSEVYGQDHITKVLENAITLGRVGHAYLFSGPRGTGKTSIARIFAKSLGCADTDIIEIDAASNRGIDDIRSLKEAVQSLPFESEKKMYIIDEVHMLTKEAFNALLKTLEEPPAHVIFVLATTEANKLLPTVISRCQHFVFRSPSAKILKEVMNAIVKKEGFEIDRDSLDMIAFLANGSFRDAQGVLQKLISSSEGKSITRKEAEIVLGVPPQKLLFETLEALAARDTEQLLLLFERADAENIDAHIFLHMLTEKVRNILRMRFSPKIREELVHDYTEDEIEFLGGLAKSAREINAKLLFELLQAYGQMEYAYQKYIPLELAIFRLFGNNR